MAQYFHINPLENWVRDMCYWKEPLPKTLDPTLTWGKKHNLKCPLWTPNSNTCFSLSEFLPSSGNDHPDICWHEPPINIRVHNTLCMQNEKKTNPSNIMQGRSWIRFFLLLRTHTHKQDGADRQILEIRFPSSSNTIVSSINITSI